MPYERTDPKELVAMMVALVAFPAAYFVAVLYVPLYHLYEVSFIALPAAFAAASLGVGYAGAARPWFPWALTLGNLLITLFAGGAAVVLGLISDFFTIF
jgi:hypothetical protein